MSKVLLLGKMIETENIIKRKFCCSLDLPFAGLSGSYAKTIIISLSLCIHLLKHMSGRFTQQSTTIFNDGIFLFLSITHISSTLYDCCFVWIERFTCVPCSFCSLKFTIQMFLRLLWVIYLKWQHVIWYDIFRKQF